MTLNKKTLLIFLPLIVYYLYQILFMAHFGFSFNDPGYLFGMGWRILQGQEIYTDFLYARPPLSPYLAAFWINILPEDGQFYYSKIVAYSYGALTSVLLFLILRRHFDEYFKGVNQGVILLLIDVFNVNYFNHFWHTEDGVMLSTIAIFIGVTKFTPSTKRIYIMSVFVLLAMMTKQSFYPLPFAIAIMMTFIYSYRISIIFIFSMTFNVFFVFSVSYIFANEQLLAYFDFKQSTSQLWPFFEAGVLYYLKALIRLVPFLLFFIILIRFEEFTKLYKLKQFTKIYVKIITYFAIGFIILFTLLAIQNAHSLMYTEENNKILLNIPILGGLAFSVVWYVIELLRKKLSKHDIKKFNILLLLISIAWCSSLSWGYKSPMFYSAIIIFFFIYLYWHNTKKHIKTYLIYAMVISFAVVSTIIVLQGMKGKINHAGVFSKKFNGTYIWNDENYAKMKYIEDEIKKCKTDNFTVLPSHPHIHWMHNIKPTLSLDWVSNVEMLNKKDRIADEIKNVECVILDKYYTLKGSDKFDYSAKEILE